MLLFSWLLLLLFSLLLLLSSFSSFWFELLWLDSFWSSLGFCVDWEPDGEEGFLFGVACVTLLTFEAFDAFWMAAKFFWIVSIDSWFAAASELLLAIVLFCSVSLAWNVFCRLACSFLSASKESFRFFKVLYHRFLWWNTFCICCFFNLYLSYS